MKTISDISEEIYENEFNGISGAPTPTSIECWLEANIGKLNVAINSDFPTTGELDVEAASIYYSMYMRDYLQKESTKALRGISTSLGVLSVREGDSAIAFTNKNEVAKTYLSQAKIYSEEISEMVGKYNMYKSFPRQAHGEDSDYPQDIFPPDPIERF